jgi:hypothetical protein
VCLRSTCELGSCSERALSVNRSCSLSKKEKNERDRQSWLESFAKARTPSDILPSSSRFLRYNTRYNNRETTYVRQQGLGIQVVDCAQTAAQESGNSSIPRSATKDIPGYSSITRSDRKHIYLDVLLFTRSDRNHIPE